IRSRCAGTSSSAPAPPPPSVFGVIQPRCTCTSLGLAPRRKAAPGRTRHKSSRQASSTCRCPASSGSSAPSGATPARPPRGRTARPGELRPVISRRSVEPVPPKAGQRPSRSARSPRAAAMTLDHIDHFVVLMLENRSFDNLLGGLYPDDAPGGQRFDGVLG